MFKLKGKNWEFEIFPKENIPKSVIVAYGLFFFFGTFGGHHFYLGHKKRGIFILLFVLPVFITTIFRLHYKIIHYSLWISVAAVGPLLVFDLITLWLQVNKFNRENLKPGDQKFLEV